MKRLERRWHGGSQDQKPAPPHRHAPGLLCLLDSQSVAADFHSHRLTCWARSNRIEQKASHLPGRGNLGEEGAVGLGRNEGGVMRLDMWGSKHGFSNALRPSHLKLVKGCSLLLGLQRVRGLRISVATRSQGCSDHPSKATIGKGHIYYLCILLTRLVQFLSHRIEVGRSERL